MKFSKRLCATVLSLAIIFGLMPQLRLPVRASVWQGEDHSAALGMGFNALKEGTDLTELSYNVGSNPILEQITVQTRDYAKTSTHYLYESNKEDFKSTYSNSKNIELKTSVPVKAVNLSFGAKFGESFESNYEEHTGNLLEMFYSESLTKKAEIIGLGGAEGAKLHLTDAFANAMNAIKAETNEDVRNTRIDSLFRLYGTHAIVSAYLGGTLEIANHVYSSETGSTKTLQSNSSLYAAVSCGNLSIGTEYSNETTSNWSLGATNDQESRMIRGYGATYNDITLTNDSYRQWAESLADSSWLVGFDEDSLIPVWELTDDAELRKMIYSRFVVRSTEVAQDRYVYQSPEIELDGQTQREYAEVSFAETNYAAPGASVWFKLPSEEVQIALLGNSSTYAEIDTPSYGMIRIKPSAPEGSVVRAAFTVGSTLLGSVSFTVKNEGCWYGTKLFAGGYGTEERPYLIATAAQLQQLNSFCSEENAGLHFRLIADIDLAGASFTPIEAFYGTLDGNNHTISNWTFSWSLSSGSFTESLCAWGLMKRNYGKVLHLSISNVNIETQNNVNTERTLQAGVLCGENYGALEHITVTDSRVYARSGKSEGGYIYTRSTHTGGIVGSNRGGSIAYCSVTGCELTAVTQLWGDSDGNKQDDWAHSRAGGIAGYATKSSNRIEHCYSADNNVLAYSRVSNDGNVFTWWTGDADPASGAILGESDSGSIQNCISDSNTLTDQAYGYRHNCNYARVIHRNGGDYERKPVCGRLKDSSIENAVFCQDVGKYYYVSTDSTTYTDLNVSDTYEGKTGYVDPVIINSLDASFLRRGWRQDADGKLYFAKEAREAPRISVLPLIKNVSTDRIELLELPMFEYKLDDGEEWTTTASFADLEPGSTHYLYVRYAETETQAASAQSNEIVITTAENPRKLLIGSKTASVGSTAKLTLELKNVPALTALALSDFTYDKDALELVGHEWKLEGSVLQAWDEELQTAAIAFAQNQEVNGIVFELTFRIKDEAEERSYPIGCTVTAKTRKDDGAEQSVPVQTVNGSVHVIRVLRGDVNGDEAVTSDDAIRVLYYTLLPELYSVNQDADFNGDGIVTSADAIYLLYYTLLPELYPLNGAEGVYQ